MKEIWKQLGVETIPVSQYTIVECVQNSDGTKVVLKSGTYEISISFGFVDALRICDEGRRIRTYNEIAEIQDYRKDFMGIPIYIVENSEFVEWIFMESVGFCDNVKHYVIVTIDDIVDIISSDEPTIVVKKL